MENVKHILDSGPLVLGHDPIKKTKNTNLRYVCNSGKWQVIVSENGKRKAILDLIVE